MPITVSLTATPSTSFFLSEVIVPLPYYMPGFTNKVESYADTLTAPINTTKK